MSRLRYQVAARWSGWGVAVADDLPAMFTVEECFFGEADFGERLDLYLDALDGLSDGQLEPLARYIAAGFPIGYMLARAIGAAISGEGDYVLSMAGRHKHVQPGSLRRQRRIEALNLGADVWRRVRDGRASGRRINVDHAVEDVCGDAADRGSPVGRTKVMAAYKRVKAQLDGEQPMVDVLDLARILPEEFEISSDGVVTQRSK